MLAESGVDFESDSSVDVLSDALSTGSFPSSAALSI